MLGRPNGWVARPEEIRLGHRLLFAMIGLLTGEATMAVLAAGHPLWLYFIIAAAIGWAFVGLPIVLPVPSRVLSQVPWPVVLIVGGCLGPLAMAAMLLTTAALHALLGPAPATFSLNGLFTGTEHLWPMASLVSAVSVGMYSALVRRRYREISPQPIAAPGSPPRCRSRPGDSARHRDSSDTPR